MASLEQTVKALIMDEFGVTENEVKLDARFTDDLGADSLDVLELRMSAEEEFGIEIPDDEAEKITTVRQLIDYLEKHTNDSTR